MKRSWVWLLATINFSCGAASSDYTEEIAQGYTWVNEGEGANWLLVNSHSSIRNLGCLKKYALSDKYICLWQGDSSIYNNPNYKGAPVKNNTYYNTDHFYIIDLKLNQLSGPYQKNSFFTTTRAKGIQVEWEPKTSN